MGGTADFRERYGPWAVVAGASEGTGRSFARALAAKGLSTLPEPSRYLALIGVSV